MPHLGHDICVRPTNGCWAGQRQLTGQFPETTEEEYEAQVRNLLRLVSACTLGLWSFSAGLLIGSFYLF